MGEPMNYDGYAARYLRNRSAVPWLLAPLEAAARGLLPGSCVVEVGSGTGNYAIRGTRRCRTQPYEGRYPVTIVSAPVDEVLEAGKERAFREVAAIDAAYARGELDDAGWHRAMAALVVPAYLRAGTLQGGSGHTGTAEDWEWSRGIIVEALDRSGTFLDIGCANGLLMESVARWGAERGFTLEPYGLDISPELAALARKRLPHWSDRISTGNALGHAPERRFDFVRTGLEYVPAPRRRALVEWLLAHVVAPGGRLLIGKFNEEVTTRAAENALRDSGFPVSGSVERAHRTEPRLAYRLLWIDATPARASLPSRP